MGLWDAIATVGSAGISYLGNKEATDAQTGASNAANALQKEQWEQSREDYAPWLGVGKNALYAFTALNGIASPDLTADQNQKVYDAAAANFQTSPGYQFRMSEGVNALDRSAASRGRLQSGAQTKAVQDFGQNLASQEYNNYLSNLGSVAGIGLQTAGQTASVGQNAVNNMSSNLLNAGNARATGYTNTAKILNQGIQNLLV